MKLLLLVILIFESVICRNVNVSTCTEMQDAINISLPNDTITMIKNIHLTKLITITNKIGPICINGNGFNINGNIILDYEKSLQCNVTDIEKGIDEKYAGNIRKWRFNSLEITDSLFWNMSEAKKERIPQVFCGDSLLKLAQWPDTGYAIMGEVLKNKPCSDLGKVGDSVGNFKINCNIIDKINREKNHILAHGYWFWDCYSNYELVDTVEIDKKIIRLKKPYKSYFRYCSRQRFYLSNLFCQINSSGKWAVDPIDKYIYCWLPENKLVTINYNNNIFIYIKNSKNINFYDIKLVGGINDCITFSACTSITINNCNIFNFGGDAIDLNNCNDVKIEKCKIKNIGKYGIYTIGGDRANLVDSKIEIKNNSIYNYSTISRTLHPAIMLDTASVGCTVKNNTIKEGPGTAIMFLMGNNHLIEKNYISRSCMYSRDEGVIYTGKDWASMGSKIIDNIIENSGVVDVNAIYIDDLASGIIARRNIIINVPTGIKLGGGRNNTCMDNVIIGSKKWLSADSRGLDWQKDLVTGDGLRVRRLKSLPYKDSIWATQYPRLVNILEDNPGCPKGNIVTNNIIDNNNKSVTSENTQYGNFNNNRENIKNVITITTYKYGAEEQK